MLGFGNKITVWIFIRENKIWQIEQKFKLQLIKRKVYKFDLQVYLFVVDIKFSYHCLTLTPVRMNINIYTHKTARCLHPDKRFIFNPRCFNWQMILLPNQFVNSSNKRVILQLHARIVQFKNDSKID